MKIRQLIWKGGESSFQSRMLGMSPPLMGLRLKALLPFTPSPWISLPGSCSPTLFRGQCWSPVGGRKGSREASATRRMAGPGDGGKPWIPRKPQLALWRWPTSSARGEHVWDQDKPPSTLLSPSVGLSPPKVTTYVSASVFWGPTLLLLGSWLRWPPPAALAGFSQPRSVPFDSLDCVDGQAFTDSLVFLIPDDLHAMTCTWPC